MELDTSPKPKIIFVFKIKFLTLNSRTHEAIDDEVKMSRNKLSLIILFQNSWVITFKIILKCLHPTWETQVIRKDYMYYLGDFCFVLRYI